MMYHSVKHTQAAMTSAMTVLLRDRRRLMASMMLFTTGNLAVSARHAPSPGAQTHKVRWQAGTRTCATAAMPHGGRNAQARLENLAPELRSDVCCVFRLVCVEMAWLDTGRQGGG